MASQTNRLVARTLADSHPAWLWTEAGGAPLWQNGPAERFRTDLKHSAGAELEPIGRQINRAIRMGVMGQQSLSRLQFTIGRKPISITALCTPLRLDDGRLALLVVDRADTDETAPFPLSEPAGLPGLDRAHVVVDGQNRILAGNSQGRAFYAAQLDGGPEVANMRVSRLPVADGVDLVLFDITTAPVHSATDRSGYHSGDSAWAETAPLTPSVTPIKHPPLDGSTQEEAAPDGPLETAPAQTEDARAPGGALNLSALVDRLVNQDALYAPLEEDAAEDEAAAFDEEADDAGDTPAEGLAADVSNEPEANSETDVGSEHRPTVTAEDAVAPQVSGPVSPTAELPAPEDSAQTAGSLWRVVARTITPLPEPETEDATGNAAQIVDRPDAMSDVDAQTQSSFAELSRILIGQMALDEASAGAPTPGKAEEDEDEILPEPGGDVVTLGDESLILNRLPLGLLVFRDQDILFANRAMSDLIGYKDSAQLRAAGLGAIFPEDEADDPVGAITHLVTAKGGNVPVTARLQSINWRGRSALLLSAQQRSTPGSGESLVRAFAETLAKAEGYGFFTADRAGILTSVSDGAARLLDRSVPLLTGRPLYGLAALGEGAKLRQFLEAPARFAGEPRPLVRLEGARVGTEVMVFAEGSAGIVMGYFGLVKPQNAVAGARAEPQGIDAALLSRVSRGIRRPLNSIVGFADLIRTGAFGPIDNNRYVDYAGNIKSAGLDIAELVDELEDYARLSDTSFAPSSADVDLHDLLAQCVGRIRAHAGAERVLVRSAISTQLPMIRADATTLGQAVLNLLASAIAETPRGGQVVLSANRTHDGGVEVHVRDSADTGAPIEDRLVVFREGRDRSGKVRQPERSSVGLALTRSLLAVNGGSLSFDATGGPGTLMRLVLPADLVTEKPLAPMPEPSPKTDTPESE